MKEKKINIYNIEILLLLFLGISQILSFSYINIGITLIILIIFLFLPLEKCIVMLFTALPFFNLLNFKTGQTSLFYLFIIIYIIKYFIYKKMKISKNKLFVLLAILVVRIPSGDLVSLCKWFLLISFFIISYNESYFKVKFKEIVDYLTISFILSSMFGLYMLNNGLSIYTNGYVYTNGIGMTTRFAGLIGDSVFLGQFSALLIVLNLVIAYFSKKNILRYIKIIIIAIFMLYSYSKTGLILAIISIISYVFLFIIKNAKSKKGAIKSLGIFIIFILSLSFMISYIEKNTENMMIKNYITRFSMNDLMTGRNEVADHYLNLLGERIEYIFVAMPLSVYSRSFTTNGINELNRSHNIFIETMCCFGIIGAIFIFTWVVFFIWKRILEKKPIICLLPLGILLASGISLHGHLEFQYYFLVALTTTCATMNFKFE